MHKYKIVISWSDADDAFIAEAPELPGCAAHGNTHQAALAQVNEAIDLRIETEARTESGISAESKSDSKPPFRVKPNNSGFVEGIDTVRLNQVLADFDTEEFLSRQSE